MSPRVVQLVEMHPTDAGYERVLRLAARFLNPTHKAFAGTSSCICEVASIHQVVCADARREFDAFRQVSAPGGGGPSGHSGAFVTKFLTAFDKEQLLQTGCLGPCDFGDGPLGPAVHFGNVFEDDSNGVNVGHEEVLLCEVAAGRVCLNPPSGLVEKLNRMASNSPNSTDVSSSAVGAARMQQALQEIGYDTMTTSVLGAPHLTVCDLRRVLPTHIIGFQRKATNAHSQTGGPRSPPGVAARPAPGAQSPTIANRASSSDALAARRRADLDAKRAAVVDGAAKAAALVRMQFRDLEEALRTRRDHLLAQLRREEELALARVARCESSLRGSNDWDANYVEEDPSAMGPEAAAKDADIFNPFTSVTLDTSRLIAMIDHQQLGGLGSGLLLNPQRSQSANVAHRIGGSSAASDVEPLRPPRALVSGAVTGTEKSDPPLKFEAPTATVTAAVSTPPRPRTSPMPPSAGASRSNVVQQFTQQSLRNPHAWRAIVPRPSAPAQGSAAKVAIDLRKGSGTAPNVVNGSGKSATSSGSSSKHGTTST